MSAACERSVTGKACLFWEQACSGCCMCALYNGELVMQDGEHHQHCHKTAKPVVHMSVHCMPSAVRAVMPQRMTPQPSWSWLLLTLMCLLQCGILAVQHIKSFDAISTAIFLLGSCHLGFAKACCHKQRWLLKHSRLQLWSGMHLQGHTWCGMVLRSII